MRRAIVVGLVTVASSTVFLPEVHAQCLEQLGLWRTGSTRAVAMSGQYAYFGGYEGVFFVAAVPPSGPPRFVGQQILPGADIQDIAVAGDYAYVADEAGALRVVNVSATSNPTQVGLVSISGWPTGVSVSGSHAYLADRLVGLRVFDVSAPTNPVQVGGIDVPGDEWGVLVRDGLAYLTVSADPHASLWIINVSVPSAPVAIGSVDLPYIHAWGVDVSGGFAYVASGGLRVIDVSSPENPTDVGGVLDAAMDVVVSGSHAYVAGDQSLVVIDISTPSNPVEVGRLVTAPTRAVAVSGNRAVLTSEGTYLSSGLRVIDISHPQLPTEVKYLFTGGRASGVTVSGSHAFVTVSEGGLAVMDVADPARPLGVGFIDTPGWPNGEVAVSGGMAYLTEYQNDTSFRVIDVSAPGEPVEVGSVDLPGDYDYASVAVSGDYAYVPMHSAGLLVFDVSDPSNPVQVGIFDSAEHEGAVDVSGSYAYLSTDDYGSSSFRVIDVSSPSNPIEVGALQDSGSWAVDVSGEYAYLTGIRVIDISTPSSPVTVASLGIGSVDVTVSGKLAYALDNYYPRLWAIDVSDPTSPVILDRWTSLLWPTSVDAAGGKAYVVDEVGLRVFSGCGSLFADGFDSGDASAWSATVP